MDGWIFWKAPTSCRVLLCVQKYIMQHKINSFSLTFLPRSTLITCLFNVIGQSSFCSRHNPSILQRKNIYLIVSYSVETGDSFLHNFVLFWGWIKLGFYSIVIVFICDQTRGEFITCQCCGSSSVWPLCSCQAEGSRSLACQAGRREGHCRPHHPGRPDPCQPHCGLSHDAFGSPAATTTMKRRRKDLSVKRPFEKIHMYCINLVCRKQNVYIQPAQMFHSYY